MKMPNRVETKVWKGSQAHLGRFFIMNPFKPFVLLFLSFQYNAQKLLKDYVKVTEIGTIDLWHR